MITHGIMIKIDAYIYIYVYVDTFSYLQSHASCFVKINYMLLKLRLETTSSNYHFKLVQSFCVTHFVEYIPQKQVSSGVSSSHCQWRAQLVSLSLSDSWTFYDEKVKRGLVTPGRMIHFRRRRRRVAYLARETREKIHGTWHEREINTGLISRAMWIPSSRKSGFIFFSITHATALRAEWSLSFSWHLISCQEGG